MTLYKFWIGLALLSETLHPFSVKMEPNKDAKTNREALL